ncbi:hypothetical protein GW17_00029822 [Ensete ventricosum]|nr:hypothetical protein GW17_00029822 [Ensete ventricosum]
MARPSARVVAHCQLVTRVVACWHGPVDKPLQGRPSEGNGARPPARLAAPACRGDRPRVEAVDGTQHRCLPTGDNGGC